LVTTSFFRFTKSTAQDFLEGYIFTITSALLTLLSKGNEAVNPPVNIQTLQIDGGYHPHVGDWLEPSTKFPNGFQPSVKEILASKSS